MKMFDGISLDEEFDLVEWFGFSSLAKEPIHYYIDNLRIGPIEPQTPAASIAAASCYWTSHK